MIRPALTRRFSVQEPAPACSAQAVARLVRYELEGAIASQAVSVAYQPICRLDGKNPPGFEALVRWFHPEMGSVPVETLVCECERVGAIARLGEHVLAMAASEAASWPGDASLSVNISAYHLAMPDAAQRVLAILRASGLPPWRLYLEVTETALLSFSVETRDFIDTLRRVGVRFALDDFGSGYSSLSYLASLDVARIKLDRSFAGAGKDASRLATIRRAMASMGHALNLEVVAEGLETADQIAAARAAGCTHGQGFALGRAMPAPAARRLVRSGDLHHTGETLAHCPVAA